MTINAVHRQETPSTSQIHVYLPIAILPFQLDGMQGAGVPALVEE